MNQAEGIVPSTRILYVCELMTLQNPEETAERGITNYATVKELLWSQ